MSLSTLATLVLAAQIIHQTHVLSIVLKEVINVHETFNSKMDALLKVTGQAERAKGVLEGLAQRDQGAP